MPNGINNHVHNPAVAVPADEMASRFTLINPVTVSVNIYCICITSNCPSLIEVLNAVPFFFIWNIEYAVGKLLTSKLHDKQYLLPDIVVKLLVVDIIKTPVVSYATAFVS